MDFLLHAAIKYLNPLKMVSIWQTKDPKNAASLLTGSMFLKGYR